MLKVALYYVPPSCNFAECCSLPGLQCLVSDLLDMRYALSHRSIFTAATAKSIRLHTDKRIFSDGRYISSLNSTLPQHFRIEEESYWLSFLFSRSLAPPPEFPHNRNITDSPSRAPGESSFRLSLSSSFLLVARAGSECC